MTRNRLAVPGPTQRSPRRFLWLIVLVAAVTALLASRAPVASARPVRIAVAPFVSAQASDAGEAAAATRASSVEVASDPATTALAERAAEALMTALRERSLDRLVAPDAFRFTTLASFEPSAQEIRRWAYNTAVEAVVIGRVVQGRDLAPDAAAASEGSRVEIVLRSGHSGAELGRHSAPVENSQSLAAAGRSLAAAILENMGYVESEARAMDALHTVGFAAPIVPGPSADLAESGTDGQASGRGLDTALDAGGFDRTAPIEIKAEEAEIINRGTGRNLVFQRNVLVRQANVTLRSDRLEASYMKGETEPERLVARGRVHIDQGGRRARCDRAVYVRSAQQLTCIGHAELVQGCDIVRGESIEFMLDQDRARVEGAASIVIRPETEAGASCSPQRGVL